jgi:signal transduction histidine kinase
VSRRNGRYGIFAFVSVVLAGYGSVFADRSLLPSTTAVTVVALLGALYFAIGIFSGRWDRGRANKPWQYYIVQVVILTAIVLLCGARGFMGIVVLPVVSQAIFDLSAWWIVAIAGYLYGICIAAWASHNGWPGGVQAAFSYGPAFAFCMAFTLITRQALAAREREAALRTEVEEANRQLREYAAQAEELATTRERNRLAREIHDGVGHYLTVVKTQLDAAAAILPDNPARAKEAVVKASRLAGEALDDVRRSVGALRTDAARPPLPEALESLSAEIGLPVVIKVDGAVRNLAPAVEHALFRSAQEGLTNIRKHAHATAAEVALDYRPEDRVVLAVVDNGRGASHSTNGGFGLRGIRERIQLLGGRVEAGNRADGGFALRIEVPA